MLPYVDLILTATSSVLSIIGACILFITFFKIKEIQNFTRLLLIYLTVADFFTATGNFIAACRYAYVHQGDEEEINTDHCNASIINGSIVTGGGISVDYPLSGLCQGQSFITTLSNLSSFIWTFIIAAHIWSSVVLKTKTTEIYCVHICYHVAAWIIPLGLVITALQKGYLGEDYCYGTGIWCGIRSDLPAHVIEKWMYIVDIGWQLTCYVFTCAMYVTLKIFIKIKHRNESLHTISTNLRNEDKNFIFIWMIIYLLKLWGIVRFFVTTYTPRDILDTHAMKGFLEFLLFMQSYGASGQAFWNCFVFCFCDVTVRKKMKSWFQRSNGERKPLLDVKINNDGYDSSDSRLSS